jgi:hypothetical protein
MRLLQPPGKAQAFMRHDQVIVIHGILGEASSTQFISSAGAALN